jgi:hypothetical protein
MKVGIIICRVTCAFVTITGIQLVSILYFKSIEKKALLFNFECLFEFVWINKITCNQLRLENKLLAEAGWLKGQWDNARWSAPISNILINK